MRNDNELLAAIRKGDQEAFEELICRYEKKIYALCARMCPAAEDAEEAAQDAFLALWRGAEEFREESSVSTWLYRLASNACIDLLRRSKRVIKGPSLDDEENVMELRDEGPTPERSLEQKEERSAIERGLAALPEDYRQVLILRELQQLSYQEISEVTQLELGTVKSRISRARQLLKNFLTADGNFFERYASKGTEVQKEKRKEQGTK